MRKVSRSIVFGGVLTFGLVLGLFLNQPSVGQPPAAPAAMNGRYEMELKAYTQGGNFTTVFVVDTQTGQCWYRDTSSDTKSWTDMGSPVWKGER